MSFHHFPRWIQILGKLIDSEGEKVGHQVANTNDGQQQQQQPELTETSLILRNHSNDDY
jgi:hypothetical protein